MTSATRTTLVLVVICISLTILLDDRVSRTEAKRANPVLVFRGSESFGSGGKSFIRYKYAVENHQEYPAELFAPSPALPPCGMNTNASRTWVDFFDQSGHRLNGFCALGRPADLNKIWFALESDVVPPSWVYMEMMDRQTNTKYKSNLSETTY